MTSRCRRAARTLRVRPGGAAAGGHPVDRGPRRPHPRRDLRALRRLAAASCSRTSRSSCSSGVPPYTPDTLIDVTIEGDRVWLRFADVFARPLHLTPEQGLALVAAGAASQGLPGGDREGPLATALAKLAGSAGRRPGRGGVGDAGGDPARGARGAALGGRRAPAGPPRLLRLRARRAQHPRRRPRTRWSPTAGPGTCTATATRRGTSACSGSTGWSTSTCSTRRSTRRPRPRATRRRSSSGRSPAGHARPGARGPLGGRDLPGRRGVRRPSDGWLRVRMAVTATPWLERLLVRLGDDARVVAADDPAHEDAGPRGRPPDPGPLPRG